MRDKILPLPEVAQLLKVAEKSVYITARRDQLSAFKVGGQRQLQLVGIDHWIEQLKEASQDEGST